MNCQTDNFRRQNSLHSARMAGDRHTAGAICQLESTTNLCVTLQSRAQLQLNDCDMMCNLMMRSGILMLLFFESLEMLFAGCFHKLGLQIC